jgi:hypothetical protein
VIFLFNIKNYLNCIFCSLTFLLCNSISYAQNNFKSISSIHDNSATEWIIYGIDSNEDEWESHLYLKWPLRDDWNHWTADFINSYISIKQQWNLDPAHWELSSDTLNVSIKQKWRNDLSEWDLIYNGNRVKWKAIYPDRLDEWYFETDSHNSFDMWTRYQGDPRDWDIEDRAPNIPDEVKLSAMFITIYLANPNR